MISVKVFILGSGLQAGASSAREGRKRAEGREGQEEEGGQGQEGREGQGGEGQEAGGRQEGQGGEGQEPGQEVCWQEAYCFPDLSLNSCN